MDGEMKRELSVQRRRLFGSGAQSQYPLAESGAGVRLTGIDLLRPLSEDQVAFLLDALVGKGYGLLALESAGMSIEDVFLELTGTADNR